jgi:hypothetical protein
VRYYQTVQSYLAVVVIVVVVVVDDDDDTVEVHWYKYGLK